MEDPRVPSHICTLARYYGVVGKLNPMVPSQTIFGTRVAIQSCEAFHARTGSCPVPDRVQEVVPDREVKLQVLLATVGPDCFLVALRGPTRGGGHYPRQWNPRDGAGAASPAAAPYPSLRR